MHVALWPISVYDVNMNFVRTWISLVRIKKRLSARSSRGRNRHRILCTSCVTTRQVGSDFSEGSRCAPRLGAPVHRRRPTDRLPPPSRPRGVRRRRRLVGPRWLLAVAARRKADCRRRGVPADSRRSPGRRRLTAAAAATVSRRTRAPGPRPGPRLRVGYPQPDRPRPPAIMAHTSTVSSPRVRQILKRSGVIRVNWEWRIARCLAQPGPAVTPFLVECSCMHPPPHPPSSDLTALRLQSELCVTCWFL